TAAVRKRLDDATGAMRWYAHRRRRHSPHRRRAVRGKDGGRTLPAERQQRRLAGAGSPASRLSYLVRISLSLLVWRRRYTRSPWRIRISRWPRSSSSLLRACTSTGAAEAAGVLRAAGDGRLRRWTFMRTPAGLGEGLHAD